MSAEDNARKIEVGVAAVNARDIPGFVKLLEPGFKLHLILKPEQLMPQGQKAGAEGFAEYLRMLYAAMPDFKIEQTGIQANGRMVHQEVIVHGAHSGPLALPNGLTLPPTGLQVTIPTEVFHSFNAEGGFISSTGYVNLMDIAKQFHL
jgi:predicted ester cyclase